MTQQEFLKELEEQELSITVFLTNGVKLQGVLTSFDDDCLFITRDGVEQLAYKHAIATIMPPMEVGNV